METNQAYKNKYYIKFQDFEEVEISKKDYLQYENDCGFFSKIENEPACADFGFHKGNIIIRGRHT